MRTYGRLPQAQPVTYGLDLPSWSLSGLSLSGSDPYTLTATGSNPAAFGPALAIPVNAGAYYGFQVIDAAPSMSLVLDYTSASGSVIASDTISYDFVTGVYDTSLAVHGATLTVLPSPSGWYQATLTLPTTFLGGVIGTQLELWPVGKGSYVTYGSSAQTSDVSYTIVPNTWVEVSTDANGYDDNVYLTTLAQCLKLNTGESPFYANYGIPQYQTIMTQVFPDYYVSQTQQQFSKYFASLAITRVRGTTTPTYNIAAVTHSGAILNAVIAQ